MADLPETIDEAADWLRSGRITSVELTTRQLARCHAAQERIAAFITICDAVALADARKADADFARGVDRGPLQGIPFAVKDNIATADAPTTANSKVLNPNWGRRPDATAVRKLREAGAVFVGKTGLYEFALGSPDPTMGFPITRNPWNLDRIPGGSSSGTAAAVAAGLVLAGLGTDTGGSIRVPAGYCGIAGLRPTYGRVSQDGCVPVAHSLDTVGPLTRTVRDCALVLQAIAGHDPADPSTANLPVPDLTARMDGSPAGVRIGLPWDYFFTVEELDPEVKAAVLTAIEQMAAAGAEIVELNLPHLAEAYAAWWAITFAENYAYHEPDLEAKRDLYAPATRRGIVTGAFITAADYVQAQRVRAVVKAEMAAAVASIDVLVTPCTIGVAPEAEDWNHFTTPSFTSLWSLLGYPALGLGCGFTRGGLPIGMQIVGKPFDEPTVFKVGDAYQRISDWHTHRPPAAQEFQSL